MSRRRTDSDLRVGGLSVAARFTLFMTGTLIPVLGLQAFLLSRSAFNLSKNTLDRTLVGAVEVKTLEDAHSEEVRSVKARFDVISDEYQRVRAQNELKDPDDLTRENRAVQSWLHGRVEALRAEGSDAMLPFWRQSDPEVTKVGKINVAKVTYGADDRPGLAYSQPGGSTLIIPDPGDSGERGLLGLVLGTTIAVLVAAAGAAAWVGTQVSGPIQQIVGDVRQIATGDLDHRTHVHTGGEIALLARSIDRMAQGLAEAQDSELELQMREREAAVASEVRDSLRSERIPSLDGFDLAAVHLSAEEMDGNFHDFIELDDGRVGLLVCDVAGEGVPGTIVGATARAYLRAELSRGGDVRETLHRVNRVLARDVRRGMYVTALYALVDPAKQTVQVACAGHKTPLVRFTAADGKVRLVQPEGIALAFDKGPIFERALQVQEVPIEAGDRLVLVNTSAVEIANPDGQEIGEKALYASVMRHGARPSGDFLERLQTVLESHADGEPLPRDVSILTVARA